MKTIELHYITSNCSLNLFKEFWIMGSTMTWWRNTKLISLKFGVSQNKTMILLYTSKTIINDGKIYCCLNLLCEILPHKKYAFLCFCLNQFHYLLLDNQWNGNFWNKARICEYFIVPHKKKVMLMETLNVQFIQQTLIRLSCCNTFLSNLQGYMENKSCK